MKKLKKSELLKKKKKKKKKKITEVKQHWAKLVLGWVTAWEYLVL